MFFFSFDLESLRVATRGILHIGGNGEGIGVSRALDGKEVYMGGVGSLLPAGGDDGMYIEE